MIIAILEAGLIRRRPPEMLMAPVAGEPMIGRIVDRVRQARTLTKLICATSRDAVDDNLTGYLTSRGVSVFRGDAGDALGGYVRCVRSSGAGYAACLSADTPLVDPGLIDEAVRYALASRSDLVTSQNYPKGLAVAVASDVALMQVDGMAVGYERALPPGDFMASRPDRFQTASFHARRDWSAMDWRADTAPGFAIARGAFEALHTTDPDFSVETALDYLDGRPDLSQRRSFKAA